MFFTKLNKQYGTSIDKFIIVTISSILSVIPSLSIALILHDAYALLLMPGLFFIGSVIENARMESEHRRIIEGLEKNFIELKKIIDSGRLSSKSSRFHIEQTEDEYHLWYEFKEIKTYPPIIKFEYDKEKKEILGWYNCNKNIKRYFEKESEEILESLKRMILERENRRESMIEHLESMEEKIEFQDEIIQKIQELITKSHGIAKSNETFLSVEDKHALVSSIPEDANEIKDVYLSFSEESKKSNKEYIKETLSVLEKRIMSISTNMEKMKQEKLHVIKEKIIKKHSL